MGLLGTLGAWKNRVNQKDLFLFLAFFCRRPLSHFRGIIATGICARNRVFLKDDASSMVYHSDGGSVLMDAGCPVLNRFPANRVPR